MSEKNSRWDEIRKIQIESASSYHILGGVLLTLFGVWLGSRLFSGDSGYGSNLFAELLGILSQSSSLIISIDNARKDDASRNLKTACYEKPGVPNQKLPDMHFTNCVTAA